MKQAAQAKDQTRTGETKWSDYDVAMLDRVQRRVLWLSTYMVHYANSIRRESGGLKVGGHQASSASVVSLLTALYFHYLRPGDLVSIKPHASPVFHAIQYLRGLLPKEKMTTLREFGGLQAYPSRTKDVDNVDFSTGSVGLGAVAPIFGALVRDYVVDHFGERPDRPGSGWQIALVGDAELDEGNVWEALGEEFTQRLSRVLWIVDLNRQSLDRVIPDGRAQKLREMFSVNGWKVIDLKYGKKLERFFRRPYGLKLRALIDEMSNEEYQSLLLKDGESIRKRLISHDAALEELLSGCSEHECKDLLANLGGHDLESILEAYEQAFAVTDRPVVIFAYTIKGWGLPIAGNPGNHSRLLKPAEITILREEMGVAEGDELQALPPKSEEAAYVHRIMELRGWTARPHKADPTPPIKVPSSLGLTYKGTLSTQTAMGSVLVNLARVPEVARHLVTVSPDVAMSTNLGGWIHRAGIYSRRQRPDYFKQQGISLLIDWQERPTGQHLELGISETNLFLSLALLGLSDEVYGQPLLPIGTVYDPFVCRALDAFIYGVYSHSRFIVVGTPAGISLSYEGGAHQSIITPAIGTQLPGVTYYEPTFGQELEWILLAALHSLHDPEHGRSAYLRLSTKPVDQQPLNRLIQQRGEAEVRSDVLRGCYRLLDSRAEAGYEPGRNVVHIFSTGAMVPEALSAAATLSQEGIFSNVFVVSSADLLFHDQLEANRAGVAGTPRTSWLAELIDPRERQAPIVTVHDGHPHTLAFLGGALKTRMINLGVTAFGQTGSPDQLYGAYGISAEAIAQASDWILREPG